MVKPLPFRAEKGVVNRSNLMTILVDRLRRGLYGLALIVAVGSLWLTGWANARQQGPASYSSPPSRDPRPGTSTLARPPMLADDQ